MVRRQPPSNIMNSNLASSRWLTSAVAGVALTLSTGSALAQNTNPTNTFDTAASVASFAHWWGITPVITWDETLDAGNDPFSGSARLEVGFTEEGDEQFMTHFTIANRWQWDNGYVLDATTYTNLSFDLKVDPSSAVTVSGANYGNLQVGLTTSTSWDNRINPPNYTIPLTATEWTHVDIPIDPAWPYLNEVVGFYVYMWSGDSHTNTLTFNLDNVMLTRPSEPVVIPAPTVALVPAAPGLNLIASTDVQYQRQNIRTMDTNLGWVDSTEPVTYELTIKDAPGAATPNFQAHLFLVPAVPNDDAPSIDWNVPNLVWFHLENLADGGGQATFRYKTNLPGGNNMLFNTDPLATHPSGEPMGVGTLGTLPSPDILGTWKLTFSSDTDATLTAPDNATLDVSIPPAAAALFTREMRLYCGIQANNATQYGKGYVFERVSVSRPAGILVEDDFDGDVLDPAKWEVRAGGGANAVFVVPPSAAWWGQWTLPAVGFSPQLSDNLAPGSAWKAPQSQAQIQILSTRRVLL